MDYLVLMSWMSVRKDSEGQGTITTFAILDTILFAGVSRVGGHLGMNIYKRSILVSGV